MNVLTWKQTKSGEGRTEWIVYADTAAGREQIAQAGTKAEALEQAMEKLGFTIMDRADWPPGKIAHFPSCANRVRNVAVLRTGLQSLYDEVKDREADLPGGTHDGQSFDVNGEYAMLAVKFDWFSVSMLNLMEGVSLLDTLAQDEAEGDYVKLASRNDGMKLIRSNAMAYTNSIPEAGPLRLV